MHAPMLVLAALVAIATAAPPAALEERQAVCRNFVIRHMIIGTDRDSVDLGSPRCCCGNTICEVSDGGMVARSILDINAQGTFRFVINGEVTAEPVPFDGGNLIVQAFGTC